MTRPPPSPGRLPVQRAGQAAIQALHYLASACPVNLYTPAFTPGMQDKGQGYSSIAEGIPEVLANLGRAKELGTRSGHHDIHQVQEHYPDKHIGYSRLGH